jgi:hypothetical protein
VHLLAARGRGEVRSAVPALAAMTAAMAPDLDLLLKLVDGQNHHQAESHTLGTALVAGLLAWAIAAWCGAERPAAWGRLIGLAWTSHVFLDYLGRDTHPPIGLPALWPFVAGYFKFPWPLFMDIGRTLDWTTVRHNAVALAWEVAVLLPILAFTYRFRLGSRRSSA